MKTSTSQNAIHAAALRVGAPLESTLISNGASSVDDFCRRYSIGRTSFYAEIKAGRLRTVKLGRKTLVLQDDERGWVASLRGEVA